MRELDELMGKSEWKMYQAIPVEEIGWVNAAHHLSYAKWREYLKRQIAKTNSQSPKITYIMYLKDYPIGVAKLKFCPGESDNVCEVAYCVRPVCRGSGLSKVMLELLKKEASKRGHKKLIGRAHVRNVASRKTMESCGFNLVERENLSPNKCAYEITL